MKVKFFIIIILLFCFLTPVFAQYEKIPDNLSKQYKKEMEQIIKTEYDTTIKNIDEYTEEAKNLRDKILKNGFNNEDYIKLALIPETNIPSSDLDLYIKLLKVTRERYLKTKYKEIGTDSSKALDEILSPYFKDNNVNKEKLTKIISYQNKKIKIVEKYIKQVEKLRPANN